MAKPASWIATRRVIETLDILLTELAPDPGQG